MHRARVTRLAVTNFPPHSGTTVSRHTFEPVGHILRRGDCKHCYLAESTHRLYDREYGREWWTQARPLNDAKSHDGAFLLFSALLFAFVFVMEVIVK
jgi:hypothetical protein